MVPENFQGKAVYTPLEAIASVSQDTAISALVEHLRGS